MAQPRHFESYSSARANFRAVLDAASAGYVTTVDRDDDRFVVVPAGQMRDQLVALHPSNAAVVQEGGGWAVILPGLPVHGDADTFDDALDDAIEALRDYAEDWNDRLRLAPNHAKHAGVVALVELSDDAQLRDWLLGDSAAVAPNIGSERRLPA